ncbi:MAG: 4Fe-4S binding protein [Candidatus Izemoplasmatales bacterium]|nr:4Fe-4S binding protein [Candidatus Izemoplasmatales bacterium]
MKIGHFVFSPGKETFKIATYFQSQIKGDFFDITDKKVRDYYDETNKFDLVFLSFPVYSQNIPIPLRSFISKIHSSYFVLNITYGGFQYGNVLKEAHDLIQPSICTGYSVTPVNHTYLNQDIHIDNSLYHPIIDRVKSNEFKTISVPKYKKSIFASFLENERTKYNVSIHFDPKLCINCQKCVEVCPMYAINIEKNINKSCILCTACVKNCKTSALTYKKSYILKSYLKIKQKTKVIVM